MYKRQDNCKRKILHISALSHNLRGTLIILRATLIILRATFILLRAT